MRSPLSSYRRLWRTAMCRCRSLSPLWTLSRREQGRSLCSWLLTGIRCRPRQTMTRLSTTRARRMMRKQTATEKAWALPAAVVWEPPLCQEAPLWEVPPSEARRLEAHLLAVPAWAAPPCPQPGQEMRRGQPSPDGRRCLYWRALRSFWPCGREEEAGDEGESGK